MPPKTKPLHNSFRFQLLREYGYHELMFKSIRFPPSFRVPPDWLEDP
jgi:hypothetical protein